MSRTQTLLLAGLLATLSGCAGSARVDVTYVDSAAVRIAINPPISRLTAVASFADRAHTILGGVRGELAEEFLSADNLTAVRMTGGRIFAHDGTHIKQFTSDGRLLSIIGRPGDGPGEFRDIQGLCAFRGDSLLATDLRGRVSVIDPAGTLSRQFRASGWIVPNACFSDGTLLIAGAQLLDTSGRAVAVEFELVSTSGEVLGKLPPLPATTYAPVHKEVSYAVHDDDLYVGDPVNMAVKVYDRGGRLLRILRTTDEPESYATDDPAAVIGEAETGSNALQAIVKAPAGSMRPMYSRMRIDYVGRIWLRTADHRSYDVAWTIFDASGALAARLIMIDDVAALPPRTESWYGREIVGFGPNEAIVLERDELGAPRFSFYGVNGLD